jgi:copper transport protein
MLALALWHRFWAIPRLASGAEVAVGRSIALEASLGLVVIALAMGFRLAPPPSLANAIAADPVSIHIHSERAMADLVATAPFPGEAGFRLTLSTGDFAQVDPKEVMLTLTDRTAGIGPLSLSAQRRGEGEWEVPPQMLPTPGPWEVRITLLITDFEQITLTGSLPAAGTE